MSERACLTVVLAAGEGTRMRSNRPKPLHFICGRAMVLHVIHALESLHPDRTALVVGHGAEQVTKKVQQLAPAWSNIAFAHAPSSGVRQNRGVVAIVCRPCCANAQYWPECQRRKPRAVSQFR